MSLRALPSLLKSLASVAALTLAALSASAQSPATGNEGVVPPPSSAEAVQNTVGGPVRLRQAPAAADARPAGADRRPRREPAMRGDPAGHEAADPGAYVPGEFERFVQSQVDPEFIIRRLGAELVTADGEAAGADVSPLVPDDYVVGPGDEIQLTLWGAVDADLRLPVDRAGRIAIPRVGTVQVSGLRFAELGEVVNRRVAQVFRNFQSSVSLGQLRGIRVFVTGFVVRPGSYTVGSLSSVVGTLMRAGGPSAAGSFRNVELRRNGALVARFDLYDLLLKGDRSADRVLQAGDVVHVGPVGTQVGFIGSVNRPAVLELKPGETVADALQMVGGFTAVADRSRLAVERLQDRYAGRVAQIELPQGERAALSQGDVLRAFSAVAVALPSLRQSKRVKVEGEVARPGEYVLPPGSTLADALAAAGGLTSAAFVYGTQFTRETVRITQQDNYDRALRDLETDLARANASQRVASGEEATSQGARSAASSRLIERLRQLKPTGRVVLQLPPDAAELPALLLEDGDRLLIPSKPTSVGVFGSVFNAGSYLFLPQRTLGDYVRLAGGPTKGADADSTFVIRASGQVISNRQSGGWLNRDAAMHALAAEPGDTLFVPEEMDKTTFLQAAKDWTQVLYQFGLGIAGLRTLSN